MTDYEIASAMFFTGLVLFTFALICATAALVEWLRNRRRPVQITVHDQLDWRDDIHDFIGGTGYPRTAVALARLNPERVEPLSRPTPVTHMEEQPHAGTR